MSIFRTGLLLATLVLSACSMPILQDLPPKNAEKSIPQGQKANTDTTAQVKADSGQTGVDKKPKENGAQNNAAKNTLIEQFNTQTQIASKHYTELKNRVGQAPDLPTFGPVETLKSKELNTAIQSLRTYISKTSTELALLNARVNEREKTMARGDIIQLFLSEATVSHDNVTFKAQPLVGQWVRGESRVIRLKDSILFESPMSEDLHVTFSETYQLIINGDVISIINPNKMKNSAGFNVATHNNTGKIVGKLDYRLVDNK
jgi:hypothetical protein